MMAINLLNKDISMLAWLDCQRIYPMILTSGGFPHQVYIYKYIIHECVHVYRQLVRQFYSYIISTVFF